jgi:FG-GAP-like repeat/FG-GAP repeat
MAALLAVLLAAGRAGAQESRAGGPLAPDYSWVPIVEPGDNAVPDPPGGEWLIDGAGLEYTLFRWEKHPGYYRFDQDDERVVTLRNGIRFTVEHHDDRYLYLRWYRTGPIAERIGSARTAADAATLPPSHRDDIPEQDLLRLEPWDEGLPRAGQWRNGFAVADLDGDGHLDIAHGPPRKGPFAEPVVFLGDGAGHWRRWVEARFPPLPYDYGDIAAGDLDGDGRMDLALAAHNSGLFALYGDGAGRFVSRSEGLPLRRRIASGAAAIPEQDEAPPPPETAPDPPTFTSRAIALADWNHDGRLDLLALAEGPTAVRELAAGEPPLGKVIFLNQEDSRWHARFGPGALMGDTLLPVDLDRDGSLDFVTDSRVVGSAELLNYGAPDGTWSVASLPDPPPGLRVRAIAVADFDADGRHDLALAFKSRAAGERAGRWGLDVLFGTAAPPGWRPSSAWGGEARDDADGPTALAAGDLDGDGDADLVTLAEDGTTSLLINDGAGAFTLDRAPETDPAPEHRYCAGYSTAIVDLDGDGRAEVVAAFAGEPGSESMLFGAVPARCRAQGALRVWKVSRPSVPGASDGDAR